MNREGNRLPDTPGIPQIRCKDERRMRITCAPPSEADIVALLVTLRKNSDTAIRRHRPAAPDGEGNRFAIHHKIDLLKNRSSCHHERYSATVCSMRSFSLRVHRRWVDDLLNLFFKN